MSHLETLPLLLKELKLTTMVQQWESYAHKAIDQQWLPQQYLALLCHDEVHQRQHRRLQRYTREAQLPAGKQLSSFDFSALPSIKPDQINVLIEQTAWIKQAHNVLLFGPSGTGKTHLACAIAYGLLEKGFRVRFYSATSMVQQLQQAKQQARTPLSNLRDIYVY